ncbi:MAG: Gfo/Idh/MocA family oxidoreductase, partial [Sedimentisphaerales bacterium]|nr:Gfo/Idh/MocA family oxidoreductase [Sedimentisphaerales bacterium]
MPNERAVIAGAGYMFKRWLPDLNQENVQVVGLVELDTKKAHRLAREYGLKAQIGKDLKAVLSKTKPDFVIDLTVPQAHCSVTCTSLRAGCPVIGEKPMAATMNQAGKMVKTSEATGKLYMVSQSRRYFPWNEQMQRIIQSGKIGDVTEIICAYYMAHHCTDFRAQMPSPLLVDMAIHHFDLARYLTGLDAEAVYAKEFNPRGSWFAGNAATTCIFEMSNGVIFTYLGNMCAEGSSTTYNGNWRIIGTKGTVICEQDQPPIAEVAARKQDSLLSTKQLKLPKPKEKYIQWHVALRQMLQFLRTGKKPQTECHDNIKSL